MRVKDHLLLGPLTKSQQPSMQYKTPRLPTSHAAEALLGSRLGWPRGGVDCRSIRLHSVPRRIRSTAAIPS